MAFLFDRYQQLTAPLVTTEKPAKKKAVNAVLRHSILQSNLLETRFNYFDYFDYAQYWFAQYWSAQRTNCSLSGVEGNLLRSIKGTTMKNDLVMQLHKSFEEFAHQADGEEFWFARELQPLLGYTQWRNFEQVIEKAKTACKTAGHSVADHFADVSKMVDIGSGAERPIEDIALTRYACYLIVQNGDPSSHGETDAFRKAGRQRNYRDTIMVTTLAPCWYCSGLIRQFNIGTVVVGESETFRGGIDWLRENGTTVIDLADKDCMEMMQGYISANPEVWDEDIGE